MRRDEVSWVPDGKCLRSQGLQALGRVAVVGWLLSFLVAKGLRKSKKVLQCAKRCQRP